MPAPEAGQGRKLRASSAHKPRSPAVGRPPAGATPRSEPRTRLQRSPVVSPAPPFGGAGPSPRRPHTARPRLGGGGAGQTPPRPGEGEAVARDQIRPSSSGGGGGGVTPRALVWPGGARAQSPPAQFPPQHSRSLVRGSPRQLLPTSSSPGASFDTLGALLPASPGASWDPLSGPNDSPMSALSSGAGALGRTTSGGGGLARLRAGANATLYTVHKVNRMRAVESQRAKMKKLASKQAEAAKQELLEQQRNDLVALRERIFVTDRKRFSKQVLNEFCAKLMGGSDNANYKKCCGKPRDERSSNDVRVLQRAAAVCPMVMQKISEPIQRRILFRFPQFAFVDEGESVRALALPDEVMHLVIRGVLMMKVGGLETKAFKVGELFVQGLGGTRPDGIVIHAAAEEQAEFIALMPCELLSFAMSDMLALKRMGHMNIEGELWMWEEEEAAGEDWDSCGCWRQVTCSFEPGGILVVAASGGGDADSRKRLDINGCRSGTHEGSLYGATASLQGFGLYGAFYVESSMVAKSPRGQRSPRREGTPLDPRRFGDKRIVFVTSSQEDRERWLTAIRHHATKQEHHMQARLASAERRGDKEAVGSFEECDEDIRVLSDFEEILSTVSRHPLVAMALYLGSLELFQHWGWQELCRIAASVQQKTFQRGDSIFEQGAEVKGLCIIKEGSVKLIHSSRITEMEQRFPGRDDLIMEEELETRLFHVNRTVCIGKNGPESTFGEERAGTETKLFRFTLVADSTMLRLHIPWENLVEEKKTLAVARTVEMLRENDINRSLWMAKRVRHYVTCRLFVDLGQFAHLNKAAYTGAAQEVESLMTLESMVASGMGSKSSADLVQHFDVEAAEGYARRAYEKLNFLFRAATTPTQMRVLKRKGESVREELTKMVEGVREALRESMRAHERRGLMNQQHKAR